MEQTDRYGVSIRAAAAIATATLNSFGLVDTNTKLIIDKTKIQRESNVHRKSLRNAEMKNLRYVDLIFLATLYVTSYYKNVILNEEDNPK